MNAIIQFADSQASRLLRFPAHSIAGLAGTSLKHEHLSAILAERPAYSFFEVHAENYMGAGGPPHRALEATRRAATPDGRAAWRRARDAVVRPRPYSSRHGLRRSSTAGLPRGSREDARA